MPLTDAFCRTEKPKDEKAEYADGNGLFLIIGTSGTKSFVQRYKVAGQSRRKTVGIYPAMKLAEARISGALLKRDVKAGTTVPEIAKKPSLSVAEAFGLYMKHKWGTDERNHPDKRQRARWAMFESNFEPTIGHRSLLDLTRKELKGILREKHGGMIAAGNSGRGIGNIHAFLSAFLAWCADGGDDLTGLEVNVLHGVEKIDKAGKRKRNLNDAEIVWLYQAFATGVANGFTNAFKMIFLTGQRRNEIMTLKRRDIVLNSRFGSHVLLPREGTKNKKTHVVPLTPQMMALLPDLTDMEPDKMIWTVGAESTSKPWGRVLAKVREIAAKGGYNEEVERFSPHDFRRTARTNMHSFHDENMRALIDKDVIPRCFNHGATDAIDDVYNQWDYIAEKRHAFTLFNDKVEKLTGQR